MTKFFRRNARVLLMVIMSLLLVAFLVPQTVQGCNQRTQEEALARGEVYGQTVSTHELQAMRDELRTIRNLGFPLPLQPEQALEYYLLVQEAEQMGLRVGRTEVIEQLRKIGMTDEFIRNLEQSTRRGYEQIYAMFGRQMSVMRLMQAQQSAMFTSIPRRAAEYRDRNQEAVAQLSVIDSRAFMSQVPEPSEAELQAFFEEAKSRVTAHTEEQLVFGYRLPDRVEVEYLTVDPAKVKAKIRLRGPDVKRYFEDNAHRYTKPDPSAAPSPDGSPAPQVPMTFEEAESLVREDLRESLAIEEAQRIVNEMADAATLPWNNSVKDDSGFLVPPDSPLVSFEALKSKFSTVHEVEFGRTGLVDLKALQRVPGLGGASIGDSQARTSAPQLALRVRGIVEKAEAQDRLPVLSLNEPAPVMMTRKVAPRARNESPYQAYLFRVVQVAPAAPPASLDDVREQLVKDWKQVRAFELAKAQAEQLAARAKEVGVAAAVEQSVELKAALQAAEEDPNNPKYVQALQPYTPTGLRRNAGFVQNVGITKNLPAELFKLADQLGSETAPAHLVALVPVARDLKWVVGELQQVKPLYEVAFEQTLNKNDQMSQMSQYMSMNEFGMQYLDPANLQRRTGFKSAPQWEKAENQAQASQ